MPRSSSDDGDSKDDFTDELTFASGTGIARDASTCPLPYRVTIKYREPEFEARLAPRPHPFQWTYRIEADDRHHAAAVAIEQFHETARLSSVSWRRDIVSVEAVAEVDDGDAVSIEAAV